ncbi:hypothetical protein FB451DRAFT_1417815 [Mycena latifolia]|nr:hypothetical protein FB451DRAFT_1417815 [Mycena latifolia]
MIPQELVNAIVDLVGDTESLKACSLASPSLCSASQRILLRSLTLKGRFDPSNYVATSTLFVESPHIAQYITNLKIELPHSRTALAGAHSIPEVLTKLSRVRQCTIEGLTREHCARWYELGEELTSALIDFLGRQPLESLCMFCVQGIPLSGFLPILTCAPTLSFAFVSIDGPYDLLGSLVNPPSITALTLDAHTETVANLRIRWNSIFASVIFPSLRCRSANTTAQKSMPLGACMALNTACDLSRL